MGQIYNDIIEYLKFHGLSHGIAIEAKPDPIRMVTQHHIWEVWQGYLASKGHTQTLAFWRSHLAHGGKGLTLPCEDPRTFDRFISQQKGSKSSAEAPRAAKSALNAYRDD